MPTPPEGRDMKTAPISALPVFPCRRGGIPARETKFAETDFSEVSADGAFFGYASVFEEVDLGRDVVMPGAFAKSLKARGPSGVRMLLQHDPASPIGVWRS